MTGTISTAENKKRVRDFYDRLWADRPIPYVEKQKQVTRLQVISNLMNPARGRTLIVGCGAGDDMVALDDQSYCTATDISLVGLQHARSRFPESVYAVADAQSSPFGPDTFDAVLCSEVLEHLPQPEQAVAEFARVLRPGGRLIVTVPNWHSSWGAARKVAEFVTKHPVTAADQPIDNWFTFRRLKKLIEAEFRIEDIRGIWYLPPLGRANTQAPKVLASPIVTCFKPLERLLQKHLPTLGHVIACACVKVNGSSPHGTGECI